MNQEKKKNNNIKDLISTDNGTYSSSRVIAYTIVLWSLTYLSICTTLQITPLISGGEAVTLIVAALANGTLRKPFEDNNTPYNRPKKRNNDDWQHNYNFDE